MVACCASSKAFANNAKWCSDETLDADMRIDACTGVLNTWLLRQETYAKAYTNRGNAYGKKGQLDRAIADYDHAIEIVPEDVDAYYNRGNVYRKKGQLDRANADRRRAIELKPDYAKTRPR